MTEYFYRHARCWHTFVALVDSPEFNMKVILYDCCFSNETTRVKHTAFSLASAVDKIQISSLVMKQVEPTGYVEILIELNTHLSANSTKRNSLNHSLFYLIALICLGGLNQSCIISQMVCLCRRRMKMGNEVFWLTAMNWYPDKLLDWRN